MTKVVTAEDIGAALKSAREARGLTQTQLAKLAGVNQPKVSEIENGKPTAHLRIVLRLLSSLELDIDIGQPNASAKTENADRSEVRTILDEPQPDPSINIDAIVDHRKG